MLLSLYSTFSATYIAAFGFPTNKRDIVLNNLVEIVFWMEILLSFLQWYKDELDYKPVRDVQKIAYRYLKTNFLIDLMATIPLRYMHLAKNPAHDDLF